MKSNSMLVRLFAAHLVAIAAIASPASAAGNAGAPLAFLNFGKKKEAAANAQPIMSPVSVLSAEEVQALNSDMQKDRTKGTWVGGVLGAVGGAVLGKQFAKKLGLSDEQAIALGAIVGGAGGAMAGKAIGNVMAERRSAYVNERAFLDSEIKAAEGAIATRERKLAETEQAIQSRQGEIVRLEGLRTRTAQDVAAARAELEKVEAELNQNGTLINGYKGGIEYIDETLKSSQLEASATAAERAEWEAKKTELSGRRETLAAQLGRLNGVKTQLENDKARLQGVASL